MHARAHTHAPRRTLMHEHARARGMRESLERGAGSRMVGGDVRAGDRGAREGRDRGHGAAGGEPALQRGALVGEAVPCLSLCLFVFLSICLSVCLSLTYTRAQTREDARNASPPIDHHGRYLVYRCDYLRERVPVRRPRPPTPPPIRLLLRRRGRRPPTASAAPCSGADPPPVARSFGTHRARTCLPAARRPGVPPPSNPQWSCRPLASAPQRGSAALPSRSPPARVGRPGRSAHACVHREFVLRALCPRQARALCPRQAPSRLYHTGQIAHSRPHCFRVEAVCLSVFPVG